MEPPIDDATVQAPPSSDQQSVVYEWPTAAAAAASAPSTGNGSNLAALYNAMPLHYQPTAPPLYPVWGEVVRGGTGPSKRQFDGTEETEKSNHGEGKPATSINEEVVSSFECPFCGRAVTRGQSHIACGNCKRAHHYGCLLRNAVWCLTLAASSRMATTAARISAEADDLEASKTDGDEQLFTCPCCSRKTYKEDQIVEALKNRLREREAHDDEDPHKSRLSSGRVTMVDRLSAAWRSTQLASAGKAFSALRAEGTTFDDLVAQGVTLDQMLEWGYRLSAVGRVLGARGRDDLVRAGFTPRTVLLLEDQIVTLREDFDVDAEFLVQRFRLDVPRLIDLRYRPETLAVLGFTAHRLCMLGLAKEHIDQFRHSLASWVNPLGLNKFLLRVLEISAADVGKGRAISTWHLHELEDALDMRKSHRRKFLGDGSSLTAPPRTTADPRRHPLFKPPSIEDAIARAKITRTVEVATLMSVWRKPLELDLGGVTITLEVTVLGEGVARFESSHWLHPVFVTIEEAPDEAGTATETVRGSFESGRGLITFRPRGAPQCIRKHRSNPRPTRPGGKTIRPLMKSHGRGDHLIRNFVSSRFMYELTRVRFSHANARAGSWVVVTLTLTHPGTQASYRFTREDNFIGHPLSE